MNMYDIYVDGEEIETNWADSCEEAVEFFKADYPGWKDRQIEAFLCEDFDE